MAAFLHHPVWQDVTQIHTVHGIRWITLTPKQEAVPVEAPPESFPGSTVWGSHLLVSVEQLPVSFVQGFAQNQAHQFDPTAGQATEAKLRTGAGHFTEEEIQITIILYKGKNI